MQEKERSIWIYSDLEGKPFAVPIDAAFRPNAKALAERWQKFSTK